MRLTIASVVIAATSIACLVGAASAFTPPSRSRFGRHLAFESSLTKDHLFNLKIESEARGKDGQRVPRLFSKMDAYEQQYQKWFSAAQRQEEAEQTYIQDQSSANGHGNHNSQQLNFIAEPSNTPAHSGYQDPYESQYQQYYQSSMQQSVAVEEEPVQEYQEEFTSHEQESTYVENFAVAPHSDPYEAQYLNYLESLRQVMPSVSPVGSQQDAMKAQAESLIASSTSRQEQQESTQQDHRQPQQQQQDGINAPPSDPLSTELTPADMEERFLRMVSNEIQYKKFLKQSPYSITDIRWPVLLQRLLDNIEDSTQKKNGKFRGQDKLKRIDRPREARKTVVVLGTGWAAHAFVKLASTYDLRVVVVSPVNHFVFTPMLASASVGTVEYRSMTEPIRVTNPYIDNFVEGRAIGIDVKGKKVQVRLSDLGTVTGSLQGLASNAACRLDPEPVWSQVIYNEDGTMVQRDPSQGAGGVIELEYDHLICAVGTAARSTIVPGAKEFCFNLKTSQDSKRLRTAIGEALEYASRPDVQEYYYDDDESKMLATAERRRRVTIAVVGGGPTGVELSGELKDFFSQITRASDGAYQHLKDDISVILVHGGSDLLPAMDRDLRQRALEALSEQGVDLRLNTRLSEVGRDFITIKEKGTGIEETIPVGITVWAAGNAPVPFVKELLNNLPPEAAGSGGRINVDQWCRCLTPTPETFGSILVLGDVACFEAQDKFDDAPEPLPQTAQVAGQQGAFVARMLNRGYDMQMTPPKLPELSESEAFSLLRTWLVARGLEEAPGFTFLSLGLLAYVGQEEALNQVTLGNVPLFNYSGKIAFALWRSVYLTKQASTRNQALIAFDWLRTETFGRDITRL
mmetsp:Transcript_5149/g.10569  ORF Transcript_5149/g.10569 Transcript_5149/m.10569 type:complete len:858 (+) Transcript_5149:139-2712(+)